jgi:hypothetical protein
VMPVDYRRALLAMQNVQATAVQAAGGGH